mmetsp:Transcript_80081/g.139007  ORF Transcript_80081/g.139007 Transcript_80081/m.139007 type:complete len:236 (-) Transcript_80081:1116-1823(-)
MWTGSRSAWNSESWPRPARCFWAWWHVATTRTTTAWASGWSRSRCTLWPWSTLRQRCLCNDGMFCTEMFQCSVCCRLHGILFPNVCLAWEVDAVINCFDLYRGLESIFVQNYSVSDVIRAQRTSYCLHHVLVKHTLKIARRSTIFCSSTCARTASTPQLFTEISVVFQLDREVIQCHLCSTLFSVSLPRTRRPLEGHVLINGGNLGSCLEGTWPQKPCRILDVTPDQWSCENTHH